MAQDIAPRRALPCSKAREPRPHAAHAHHRPCAQHFPRNKQARPEHCSAHTALCAQTTGPDTAHVHRLLPHAHRPDARALHTTPARPQHRPTARAALPLPTSTPQSDLWVPASSSSRSRLFLDTIRSSTLTIAANARCADSSRSAAPASLQPAAAAAAPAQHSPRSAAGLSRDALRTYARATFPTRHVPYPYPLSTNRAREEGGVADYVTLRGWHRPSPDARESFSKSQMFTVSEIFKVSKFQTSHIFRVLMDTGRTSAPRPNA